ncbi:phosphoglycerate dehydrogenase [Phosphitispora fastidiosa]|uniref:phosphoglycerate dehydrogenase n=1 Tax=Phosphitispora fastidiosa TaxID=2837202 RepID=UPI001E4D8422|nr:phosphoglycerate dehydrogenase [Phosphitispora fastidiosa]MBU7005743.1 D-3-phosphoglycerate dehydrogenase [Phosphitispora fastidiosa]
MKVLVLDNVSEKAVRILSEGGIEAVVNNNKLSEDDLCGIISEYAGVIVRSATKITAPVIAAAKSLKIIGRAGVGVDNIDIPAATNAGVIVVNAPDGNTIAATEQTMALMLGLARNLPQAHKDLKEGKWMRKEYLGVELRNKVLGIVGLGRIGTAVAKRAQAFEMKTIGYDPMVSPEAAAANGIVFQTLEEVIKEADFLTLHIPKTKESFNLINRESLAMMKDGARIINVARGGIVNETDLYGALKGGKLGGAALDVFAVEPTTDSPLFELNNVIIAPHLGASTREAQVNVALDVAEEFVNVLVKGEMAANAVNVAPIKPDILAAVKPYLALAEKLGKMQAQLVEGSVKNIRITYTGELVQVDVSPLTVSFLKGFLESMAEESGSVNFVNAPILAKERGITVEEIKTVGTGDYTALISASTESAEVMEIAGTLFGKDDPRIVMVDGFRVDVVPFGNILVVPHQDRPKVAGPVASIVGEHDLNIAGMQVGRKSVGGKAIIMLAIDTAASDEVLAEIMRVDGVLDVKMVTL